MKKDGKRIIRFKTGATKLQGAAYLQEMAEQGWILEDMNHLTYSFREDEPQYLRYRMEELEHAPTGEELAEYAKDGWQNVCSYELEYIFVKERDPFAEDTEEEKEEVLRELDRKIELERKNERSSNIAQIAGIAIGGFVVFLIYGFSWDVVGVTAKLAVKLLPWILLGAILSRRRLRKLHQEKEAVIGGDIPDEYTDWRGQRKGLAKELLLFVAIIGVWGYYVFDKNEVLYDLPQEINYVEVPAPRLENIEEEKLIRVGGDIARQKAARGDHSWHIYDNSVTEGKHLFIVEKFEIEQQMSPVGKSEEISISTDYHGYVAELLAERHYRKELKGEEESYPGINVSTQTVLDAPRGNFDALHVCRREYVDETVIHILCKDGEQVMDLTYNGKAEVDDILMEIQKVFLAQK